MNVLLFVIDTLRADHLSCYDYFRDTSPNIDNLAQEGVLFLDHYASGVPTGPGFTSIITGLFPVNHGFYLTPYNIPNSYQLDDNILTLAEVMWENGYVTAAFDNLVNFRSRMKQFIRGYEYYVNVTRTAQWLHHPIWADLVNQRLVPWIEEHRKEEFFLFVHYWDPHTPYNQPKEYRELFHHERGNLSDLEVKEAAAGYQYVPGWGKTDQIFEGKETRWKMPIPGETFAEGCSIDLYDGEVAYVDNRLGQVVEKLKEEDIFDETLIIVTSDHGEQLGQHGMYGHSGLHDANIYVPLIMTCTSELPKGKRVKGFVQQVDISTTIFEMMDISVEKTIEKMRRHAKTFGNPAYSCDVRGFTDGKSLLNLIGGSMIRGNVFSETETVYLRRGEKDKLEVGVLGQRANRTDEWKLIIHSDGRKELYNVRDDPMEVIDLSKENREVLEDLNAKLDEWVKSNLKGRRDPILMLPTTPYYSNDQRNRQPPHSSFLDTIPL